MLADSWRPQAVHSHECSKRTNKDKGAPLNPGVEPEHILKKARVLNSSEYGANARLHLEGKRQEDFDLCYPSPYTILSLASSSNTPVDQSSTTISPSSAPPVVGTPLAVSQRDLVHQSSTAISSLVPMQPAELTPNTCSSAPGIPVPYPQSDVDRSHHVDNTATAGAPATYVQNNIGDCNTGNHGIIGHSSINILAPGGSFQFNHARESRSTQLSPLTTATIYIEATQRALEAMARNSTLSCSTQRDGSEGTLSEESIKVSNSETQTHLRDRLSELRRKREQLSNTNMNSVDAEILGLHIVWRLRLFLFVNHMRGNIPTEVVVEGVKKKMMEAQKNAASQQSIKDLPRARAAYDDYVSCDQRRVSCFEGTRQALLREMGEWVANSEAEIFVLSGLAGIGKSTIAQTIAERADNVRLLGASFFFSRDDAERRTAERFFTTIAFQFCIRDPEFSSAIESVLMTDQGKDAITKRPLEQLETLIVEPLRRLAPRRVVIVIDALDECDDGDAPIILQGLSKLVQSLPFFKIILTTRPQPHLQFLLDSKAAQKILHLHNIEDKIVDGDIELYLRHNLAWEQVRIRLPALTKPWAASDEDIQSLVRAAGRLFIIASTAILFILDRTSTPTYRMKMLRMALDRDYTPFNALNNFYITVLRIAVPKGCERDTVLRYQTIIGAIILMQQPLPISALATLIDIDVDDINAVLGNLQPVILLGRDSIPLVYHKSFPDYIQDPERCNDGDLHIDPKQHHSQMAIHCLRLLNKLLKQNIMELDGAAQFMDNDEALKKQGLTANDLLKRIPRELQYACSYFTKHIESIDVVDTEFWGELERFLNRRLLNWLETLSWIGKMDSLHRPLLALQKLLAPTSSDLCHVVADALRFIGKFYQLLKQSALYIYHSALPFTPTETSLYTKYSREMTFCRVYGVQKKWDGLITKLFLKPSSSENTEIIFSANSTLFACFEEDLVTIYDAVAGIPLGRIEGITEFAIADDFSKAAGADDSFRVVTLYKVKDVTPIATIEFPAKVWELILSSDGSRLVAMLEDDSVSLLDTETCRQIKSFDRLHGKYWGVLALRGCWIAFATRDDVVTLLDGRTGQIVAVLSFPMLRELTLMFSGDGARLACLTSNWKDSAIRLWRSEDGRFIAMAEDVGRTMAISTDGSLLATEDGKVLKLWSGNDLALLETLDLGDYIRHLAIHNGLLAIGTDEGVQLYDTNSRTFIARLEFQDFSTFALSPDGSRLAVADYHGDDGQLLDVSSITASTITSQEQSSVRTELTFSPDCTRLASAHSNGVIKLWDTSDMTQLAAHKFHSKWVRILAFSTDGGQFASGSQDGVIGLWNGKDGAPSGVLECYGSVQALALSSGMLAVATHTSLTLWDLKTRAVLCSFAHHGTNHLALSKHDQLLGALGPSDGQYDLTLWNMQRQQTLVTSFQTSRYYSDKNLVFSPDCSRLTIICDDGDHRLFDIHDDKVLESRDTTWLGSCFHGIPVSAGLDGITGQFPQQKDRVTVLKLPSNVYIRTVAQGSSMIAVGCDDGRIFLVKPI